MENNYTVRTRFQKPYHYLVSGDKNIAHKLRAFFNNFQLGACRDELNFWQKLALANDESVYDEAYAREDLMDFVEALRKVVEAFWLIYQRNRQENSPKILANLNKQIHYLDDNEVAKPGKVIKHFCSTFKRSYAFLELMDLLDAVVTYKGAWTVNHCNLVLFYQYMKWLIRLAYRFKEKQADTRN